MAQTSISNILQTLGKAMFSFKKRGQIIDASRRLRKIIDLTCPNLPKSTEGRSTRRYNRSIAIAIADWAPKDGVALENLGFGFTTDMSENGFCVLTQFFPKTKDNVIGFFLSDQMDEPSFFHVRLASYRLEAQSYLRFGYSVVEYLNDNYSRETELMTPAVTSLLKPSELVQS